MASFTLTYTITAADSTEADTALAAGAAVIDDTVTVVSSSSAANLTTFHIVGIDTADNSPVEDTIDAVDYTAAKATFEAGTYVAAAYDVVE